MKNEKASIDYLEECLRLLRPSVRGKGVAKPHVGHCVRWLRDCCGEPELATRLRKLVAHRNAEAHPDSRALLADLQVQVLAGGSEPEPETANAKSTNEQEANHEGGCLREVAQGRSDSFLDKSKKVETLQGLQQKLDDLNQSHYKLQEEARLGVELQNQLTQVKQSHDEVQKQAEQAKVHALQLEDELKDARSQIKALQTLETDMQRENLALLDKLAHVEHKEQARMEAQLAADIAALSALDAKEKYKSSSWNSKNSWRK